MIRTVPAREIKRRGIGVVDEDLREGPVHVIRNDQPAYVILSEEQYQTLLEDQQEAYLARLKESFEDLEAGRVTRGTAQDLIDELGLER